jgi:hypothetical protein
MGREVLCGTVVGPRGGLRSARLLIGGGRIDSIELGGPSERYSIVVAGFMIEAAGRSLADVVRVVLVT